MLEATLDLETFSLKAGGVIRSVGLVIFDRNAKPGEFVDSRLIVVKEDTCLEVGMHKDPATVEWWEGQSQEAKNHLMIEYPYQTSIQDTLASISQAYKFFGCKNLWSHGILADGCWIEEAYNLVGDRTPWSFRDHRDTRTLYELAKINDDDWHEAKDFIGGPAHDPLVDAKVETYLIQKAAQRISK